jgi:hypothetical protein
MHIEQFGELPANSSPDFRRTAWRTQKNNRNPCYKVDCAFAKIEGVPNNGELSGTPSIASILERTLFGIAWSGTVFVLRKIAIAILV